MFIAVLCVSAVAGKTSARKWSAQERRIVKDLFLVDHDLMNLEKAESPKQQATEQANVAEAAVALGGSPEAYCSASLTPCGDQDEKCASNDNHVSELEKSQWCVGFCLKKADLESMMQEDQQIPSKFNACYNKIGSDGISGCCFSGVYNTKALSLNPIDENDPDGPRAPNDSLHMPSPNTQYVDVMAEQ